MRCATAWFRNATAAGAAAFVAFIGQACESTGNEDGADGTSSGGADCVADTANDTTNAIPLPAGQKQSGTICPRGDRDWYAIDVPAGSPLVDLSASYPGSVTKVKLFVRLHGADGAPLADGEIDDATPRGGTTSVATTLKVPQPGRYYLEMGDVKDIEGDSRNSYVLNVAFAADPDTHEPNDDIASAKSPDGAPGFLAFRGDRDVFKSSVPDGNSLLRVTLTNPAAAKAAITYQILSTDGTVVAQGSSPPAAAPLDALRAVGKKGDFFVALQYGDGSQPDRRPEAGYSLALSAAPEPDTHETPARNDTAVAATCPGGGAGPCTTAFSGTGTALPSQTGYVASLGDRDVYRVDVASGAPAILQADLQAGSTPLQLALDLLTPHAGSPCTTDAQCNAINVQCTEDSDCELSHKCLDNGEYAFCTKSPCRLCEGAGACVPSGAAAGPRVCAAAQYTMWDTDGGTKVDAATGKNRLRTAQPLFGAGPYYVVVHDFQDKRFDTATPYTLALTVSPEPDPNDSSATPEARNNFYNPYPLQSTDLSPNKSRAKDITAAIAGKTAVTGYLSYAQDEDWYSFTHPCPGLDCGLVFEWTQPGPSEARPAFIIRRDDMGIHESWTYMGSTPTTQLSGPVTGTFGGAGSDCHECSFASKDHQGTYYIQVRDVGQDSWDYSSGGQYSFRLTTQTTGCPTQCSEWSNGCGCFCKALDMCPASPAL
jgi:hypothetical protein